MKRTHLPLNGLRVLDAAARHLSFTRAADELAVTPAAVGQQVRALEDTLGVVLFRRTTKGLELTPEAEAGLAALRAGFLQFEEAVRAMQAGQSSKSLTIAAPRDLTAKWLMAKLAEVARTDSELRFVLVPADDAIDFTEANLDLAIRWGEGPGEHEGEAGLAALRGGFLQFEEAVRAMQAGQSSRSLTIAAPRDLTQKWLLPRLSQIADREMRFVLVAADDQLDFTEANLDLAIRWGEGPGAHQGEAIAAEGTVLVARPDGGSDACIAWPGCPDAEAARVRVGDAGLAIDAAAAGLGQAHVPELLARADIAAGRVVALEPPQASAQGYWMVAPLPQWRQKKVRALVEALGG